MTIYVDVVLIENLCMNYILLLATGRIVKSNIKHIRTILASLIGSTYAIISLFSLSNIVIGLIVKVILSLSMVYLSLNPKSIKILLKQVIIFYVVTFTFGGLSFAMLYFLKPAEVIMKNRITNSDIIHLR